MPFSEDYLNKLNPQKLKHIFNAIAAHKSALKKYSANKPHDRKKQREAEALRLGRKDLVIGKAYSELDGAKAQREYLVPKILNVQDKSTPYMEGSKYANEDLIDYAETFDKLDDGKESPINRATGYVGNEAPPQIEAPPEKPKEQPKPEKQPEQPKQSLGSRSSPSGLNEPEKQPEKQPEKPKEPEKQPEQPEPEKPKVEKKEEEKEEVKPEVKRKPEEKFKLDVSGLGESLGAESEYNFEELADRFDDYIEILNTLNPSAKGSAEKFDNVHKELLGTIKGMLQIGKTQEEQQIAKDKARIYNENVSPSISRAGAKTANVKDIKEGLKTLKEDKEMAKAIKPSMQYVEDIEKLQATPETVYESKEKNVFVDQSNKGKTVGDSNIGNVRAIGIAPMTAPAREAEIIPPPSERAKSLKRFANFRWVYSNQNSDLGYDSPFQRIQDQEDKRRFGMCYLPTSKLPKPETQEDLNKVKSFNTYPLVPSQNLSGIMQPAGELSFKSSTNPNARKITIDEKQFANTKLYNFEPTQVNIKSNNPFSGMYGMQPLDQIKRNPDIQANTLEFSSAMYDDCPLERIKNKYNKKIIT